MSKTMLIDASHKEETRVCVVNEEKEIETFDFETETKKIIKGNIYLGIISRVEPALQAAFVDYGENRNGFLPFSEIHDAYYQGSPEEGKKVKIQDVIKKKQLVLVQVIRDERNTKGSSLTTNLSLAGKYCVLLVNKKDSGGVSKNISSDEDRERLKKIVKGFKTTEGTSIIVRTAGAGKTKSELSKDFNYLLDLWDNIRERTYHANAPELIHEEANIIKRSIRDYVRDDVGEIIISGHEKYLEGKDYISKIIPKYKKKVYEFDEQNVVSLFNYYGIERQLSNIYNKEVFLPSGGSIVIDQTEALVAIDVNSGKAIKQNDIQYTALKTNLEAAEEISYQLRLRDMAGIVVVDFIDMIDEKHVKKVEQVMKSCLRHDKSRIHLSSISSLGLMEISRQRTGSSILESTEVVCKHCDGKGTTLDTEIASLNILRSLEDTAMYDNSEDIIIKMNRDIAAYLLNKKRKEIVAIEEHFGISIDFIIDDEIVTSNYLIAFASGKLVKDMTKSYDRRMDRYWENKQIHIINEDDEIDVIGPIDNNDADVGNLDKQEIDTKNDDNDNNPKYVLYKYVKPRKTFPKGIAKKTNQKKVFVDKDSSYDKSSPSKGKAKTDAVISKNSELNKNNKTEVVEKSNEKKKGWFSV